MLFHFTFQNFTLSTKLSCPVFRIFSKTCVIINFFRSKRFFRKKKSIFKEKGETSTFQNNLHSPGPVWVVSRKPCRLYAPFYMFLQSNVNLCPIFTHRQVLEEILYMHREINDSNSNYVIANLINEIHVKFLTFICLNLMPIHDSQMLGDRLFFV